MGSLVILFLTKHVNNVKKQLGIVPVYYVFVVDIILELTLSLCFYMPYIKTDLHKNGLNLFVC
jgi:hypothetical protein